MTNYMAMVQYNIKHNIYVTEIVIFKSFYEIRIYNIELINYKKCINLFLKVGIT